MKNDRLQGAAAAWPLLPAPLRSSRRLLAFEDLSHSHRGNAETRPDRGEAFPTSATLQNLLIARAWSTYRKGHGSP